MGQEIDNSENHGSVTFWIERLKAGDVGVADQLFARYAQQMARKARKQFRKATVGPSDPDDVVQSVFRVLIAKADNGNFPSVADRRELLPLLLTITANKAIDRLRKEQRSVSMPEAEELYDDSLPPVSIITSADQVRHLFDLLGDHTLRRIAIWKVEGLKREAIATELGVSVKTVSRKLGLIREVWERELECNR